MLTRTIDTDHPDATDDAKFRIMGIRQAGLGTPSLAELKAEATKYAKSTGNAMLSGLLECGLELPPEDYDALKAHVTHLRKNVVDHGIQHRATRRAS